MSLRKASARLSSGEISSVELVREHLELARSIAATNAFITLREERAIEEARKSDEARHRGEHLGPLHGIPITAKDIVWSEGDRTTSGSRLRSDFVAPRNAPCLARLRRAGAILLGKTNLHEFAYGVSNVNPHFGAARNPWDRDRISGGSSGGSAVALAFGVGYGSIGTDTGGSVRIPSALCGTVGLKPTYGAVPRDDVTPLSWSLDHIGPMSRDVSDAAILFELMSETSVGLMDEPSLKGLKLGLHESYFFEGIAGEVERCVRGAVAKLSSLGMETVDARIPEIELQAACRNTIAFAEASSYHHEDILERPELYGADTRELLRLGLLVSATDYLAATRARREIVRAFRRAFRGFDVLATPMTVAAAPKIGDTALDNGEELRVGLLRMASPFNTTGFPAISVPCGVTDDGRPIGLQLASAPGTEALLLRVARAFELACEGEDWSKRSPAV